VLELGVLLNLTSFGLAVLGLVGLMLLVTFIYRAPTRPCHRCGKRVRLGTRLCNNCGYDFEPVRMSR
jgi:hypothetical protein